MNNLQKKQTQFSAWYFLGAILLLFLFQSAIVGPLITGRQEVSYDQFRQHLADGSIMEATIEPERIIYVITNENR